MNGEQGNNDAVATDLAPGADLSAVKNDPTPTLVRRDFAPPTVLQVLYDALATLVAIKAPDGVTRRLERLIEKAEHPETL